MYPEMNKTIAGPVIRVLFTTLGGRLSLERMRLLERSSCKGARHGGVTTRAYTEGMNLEE